MTDLTKALFTAAAILDRHPACDLMEAYGPDQCRVHEGGRHYPNDANPWCSKAPAPDLRAALVDLLDAMEVTVGSRAAS